MAKTGTDLFWERLRWFRGTTVLILVIPLLLALIHQLGNKLSLTSNTLILLVLTVLASIGNSIWVAIVAAAESFLFLNYYLTPPFHSFRIRNSDDSISLIVFVVASICVSLLLKALTTKEQEIEFLVRRIESFVGKREKDPRHQTYLLGCWQVNPGNRSIQNVNESLSSIHLTPTEWKVLETLLLAHGSLVTQKDLLKTVWGEMYSSETNYLRLYLSQLRGKLELNPKSPEIFITEPGVGYRVKAILLNEGNGGAIA
jgi:DNA-binding winged helix-turn-helix (wHTH) protein